MLSSRSSSSSALIGSIVFCSLSFFAPSQAFCIYEGDGCTLCDVVGPDINIICPDLCGPGRTFIYTGINILVDLIDSCSVTGCVDNHEDFPEEYNCARLKAPGTVPDRDRMEWVCSDVCPDTPPQSTSAPTGSPVAMPTDSPVVSTARPTPAPVATPQTQSPVVSTSSPTAAPQTQSPVVRTGRPTVTPQTQSPGMRGAPSAKPTNAPTQAPVTAALTTGMPTTNAPKPGIFSFVERFISWVISLFLGST